MSLLTVASSPETRTVLPHGLAKHEHRLFDTSLLDALIAGLGLVQKMSLC
jgi:hypothetical protein